MQSTNRDSSAPHGSNIPGDGDKSNVIGTIVAESIRAANPDGRPVVPFSGNAPVSNVTYSFEVKPTLPVDVAVIEVKGSIAKDAIFREGVDDRSRLKDGDKVTVIYWGGTSIMHSVYRY